MKLSDSKAHNWVALGGVWAAWGTPVSSWVWLWTFGLMIWAVPEGSLCKKVFDLIICLYLLPCLMCIVSLYILSNGEPRKLGGPGGNGCESDWRKFWCLQVVPLLLINQSFAPSHCFRAGSLTRVSSCAYELFSSFEGALIENPLVKIISFWWTTVFSPLRNKTGGNWWARAVNKRK